MIATEREILHRLLTHFHPENFEDFLKYFEEHERIPLSKIQPVESPLNLRLDDPLFIFHRIHYTWYIDALRKLPKGILNESLSLFSKEQKIGLSRLDFVKKPKKMTSSWLTSFYLQYLLKSIGYDTIPPLCFLPDSKSHHFLNFSKKQLVALIQHLGILELANLSKKIVDKRVLTQMERMLSRADRKLFKNAKLSSEPNPSSVRDLSKVLLDKKAFFIFIEKRGIERFAKGIVLDHPYMIWHIAHILDKGRGQELLIKARRFMPNPYTPFFNKQVLEVSQTLEVDK